MSNELAQQYGFQAPTKQPTDMVQIEQSRAMHEIQSAIVMARKFPRDMNQAFANIMKACERPSLAEQASYAFPRGGEIVTGPSIRLAEIIAQNWGNIIFGMREISQVHGISVAQAFAWDLETNVKQIKEFQVPHKRYSKQKGVTDLVDPRDIYEAVANNGARRLRACLLGVIPPDIIEAAEEQCKKTLKNGKEPLQDRIKKLVLAFDEMGIKVAQIEEKLGHKLDATLETELVKLRAIYKSIKDGIVKREDFFSFGSKKETDSGETKTEQLANKLAKKNEENKAAAANPELEKGWEDFKASEEEAQA